MIYSIKRFLIDKYEGGVINLVAQCKPQKGFPSHNSPMETNKNSPIEGLARVPYFHWGALMLERAFSKLF